MKIPMSSISWVVRYTMLISALIGALIGVLISAMALSLNISSIAQAKSPQKIKFRLPAVPKGDPPRGTPSGGAARDNCPQVAMPLTVMMPTSLKTVRGDRKVYEVFGLTTLEAPALWFYSPYDNGDRFPVELIIRQNHTNGKILARRSVTLPSKPGLFQVSMPDHLAKLNVDERRYWQLNLMCKTAALASQPDQTLDQTLDQTPYQTPYQTIVPIVVSGVFQRVTLGPEVLSQLSSAQTPHDRALLYADRGIWLDALDTIGNALSADPKDPMLKDDWKDLLDSVCLTKFVLEW
jgi:Domain of Unknown Function (DUF928)